MLVRHVLSIAVIIASTLAFKKSYRLPTDVKPKLYTLDLTVDPDADTFNGVEHITLLVNKATASVSMHASPKFIDIQSIKLIRAGKQTYTCVHVTDETTEILRIACPVDAVISNDVLEITYQGKLSSEDMDGFYRSSYTENGKQKNLAATQFEPVYARRAFPCFDEPTFKAEFQVSITRPKNYTVLFNTPEAQSLAVANGDNIFVKTQFEKTPVMSTYLVAFVVSDFVKAQNSDSTNKPYQWNVFARSTAKESMGTALKYSPQLIDFMGKWTELDYVKLGNKQVHQVAIPDFAAGAMENWGLITYREVDLLDEGAATSANSKQNIIQTIAHELSHQWFGDYVTIDWWSNLWLNEGFATYFQCHLANLVENGTMELDKQFITWVVHRAFQSDALYTTTPISNEYSEINTPTEINKKFDDISYSKAGSVIRMMEHMLGKDVFQKALRNYLKGNGHTNASPKTLFSFFKDAAPPKYKNIDEIMHNWIYQPGFPLVQVDWNETAITISQERFNSNATTQWYIPITFATSQDLNFTTDVKMMLEPGKKIVIQDFNFTWIMLNTQVAGFYRVNYHERLWTEIIKYLEEDHDRIHVLNRAQLIDDVFNNAKIGKVKYSLAFALSGYLKKEKDYYPWFTAFRAFSFLLGKLDKEADDLIKDLVRDYIDSAFGEIPSGERNHVQKLTDGLIVQWACKVGHEKYLSHVKEQFDSYKTKKMITNHDIRSAVFCYGLRQSSNVEQDYEFMYGQFKNSLSSTEQNAILQALGCINDVTVLNRYLNETIQKESAIRKQDAATVFSSVLGNSDNGLEVALKFFESNFDEIDVMYKGLNAITRLSTELARNIVNQEHSERVSFFKLYYSFTLLLLFIV
ncbi:unnamed protein product [Acanthoscelides obtectus]|uniref:Aminopeptidase n=1 Tax=Acanthoscelides obtectus TaxID=200917 RepID=A0A9P0P6I8_ACAOB|nr:unnamed protein product [Acanthoscelides obtectus]CAK1635747.1 Aminopeptidase N [Acanthoscelides obtectus]